MKGIYPDFIKLLEKKSGMRFKISGYGPQRSAFQLLEAGKADVLLDAVSASSLKNKGRLALSDSFYDMPYVVPVSYTHLDVYKRQASYTPGRIRRLRYPG